MDFMREQLVVVSVTIAAVAYLLGQISNFIIKMKAKNGVIPVRPADVISTHDCQRMMKQYLDAKFLGVERRLERIEGNIDRPVATGYGIPNTGGS